MYEKYWEDKRVYDQNKQNSQVAIPNPSESITFNNSILFKTIEDIDSMTDVELKYFISNNYRNILNNVFSMGNTIYINAFRNVRFLMAFRDVMTQIQFFDPEVLTHINIIIYEYLQLKLKDDATEWMYKISDVVNRSRLTILRKYELPYKLANDLVILSHSHFDLQTCVKRVDLAIQTSKDMVDILDVQDDTEVSEKAVDYLAHLLVDLYDLNNFRFIIPYMMLDVLPYNDGTRKTRWITYEIETIDAALNLAILQILDTMIPNSDALIELLVNYSEGYTLMHRNMPTRFSFQCVSGDFPRLRRTVEYLKEERHIIVP